MFYVKALAGMLAFWAGAELLNAILWLLFLNDFTATLSVGAMFYGLWRALKFTTLQLINHKENK